MLASLRVEYLAEPGQGAGNVQRRVEYRHQVRVEPCHVVLVSNGDQPAEGHLGHLPEVVDDVHEPRVPLGVAIGPRGVHVHVDIVTEVGCHLGRPLAQGVERRIRHFGRQGAAP